MNVERVQLAHRSSSRDGDNPRDLVAGKTISQILGEIAWLLSQSRQHNSMAIGQLETLVMPAILLKQLHIQYFKDTPVRIELWAMSDDADIVAKIRRGGARNPMALWTGGSTRRDVLVADLREQKF